MPSLSHFWMRNCVLTEWKIFSATSHIFHSSSHTIQNKWSGISNKNRWKNNIEYIFLFLRPLLLSMLLPVLLSTLFLKVTVWLKTFSFLINPGALKNLLKKRMYCDLGFVFTPTNPMNKYLEQDIFYVIRLAVKPLGSRKTCERPKNSTYTSCL